MPYPRFSLPKFGKLSKTPEINIKESMLSEQKCKTFLVMNAQDD